MVADVRGRRTHSLVADALLALANLEHRGAKGADPNSGDGAGILIQLPAELLGATVDFELPPANAYAAGTSFLPVDDDQRARAIARIERLAADENVTVLGWREVPV